MTTELTQTVVAGTQTGSLMNYLYGNNSSIPVVGNGATMLLWSDRHAYEVISVSDDLKKVTLQRYDAERIDSNGMSDAQNYKYEKLVGNIITIVYKKRGWVQVTQYVGFTPEFEKEFESNFKKYDQDEELKKQLWPDGPGSLALVEGKTKNYNQYNDVKIIFGVKREYYDYSF